MRTCSLESGVDEFRVQREQQPHGYQDSSCGPPEEMLEVEGLYLQNPEMDVNFTVLEEQREAGSDSV